jgi:hypothetical protein
MPSCLLSERPGSALHVGEFVHVHVREVEGRDKGRLKQSLPNREAGSGLVTAASMGSTGSSRALAAPRFESTTSKRRGARGSKSSQRSC